MRRCGPRHGYRRLHTARRAGKRVIAPGGLVALAHQLGAIEQPYQERKGEFGLDYFGGQTYPAWRHRGSAG